MSRRFGAVLVPGTAIVIFAITLWAQKPSAPTKEYRDIMRSNASIVDLSGSSILARETNIDIPRETAQSSLNLHAREKNYDGIVADATALQANFRKLEAFWTEQKVEDAIGFSKDGLKAANALEAAARAKDDKAIAKAHNALADTCRDCHLKHRVILLTDRSFQIRY